MDRFEERAAQLWCEPAHSAKEMDVEFAASIAQALRETRNQALEEAAAMIERNEVEGYIRNASGIVRALGERE